MLKNSARNCALKLSEMRFMWLFLKTEKSSFDSPGPTTALRPKLPLRFAQVPAMPAKVWHWETIAGVD